MKLVVSQLKEGENPLSFNSLHDKWVEALLKHLQTQGAYQVRGAFEMSGTLTKLEPDYYLRARLRFEVNQVCSRCAEPFALSVQHPFGVALAHVPAGQARESTENEESEELDITYFSGNELELAPILEEQFVLSMPYQAVCQTDCKGVCQRCGKNLNLASCTCASGSKPNAFSALKDIKIEKVS